MATVVPLFVSSEASRPRRAECVSLLVKPRRPSSAEACGTYPRCVSLSEAKEVHLYLSVEAVRLRWGYQGGKRLFKLQYDPL